MSTNQEIPREAIHAYNLYIHGEIDRRSFFDRVKKVAVSTAAAAAIVDQLMPNYAAAQQVAPNDSRLKTETVTIPAPQGNGNIKGYLVRPAAAGANRLPAILVIHENRGLNPHIQDVARPRPTCQLASSGSRSGPIRRRVAARGLAVVAPYPSNGGEASSWATTSSSEVISGRNSPSLMKLRLARTASSIISWGISWRSRPG